MIILLLIIVVVSLYCAELVLKKRSFFSSSSRTNTARSVPALGLLYYPVQLQLVVVPGIVQYVMYYKYLALEALVVAVVCEGPISYHI